MADRAASAKSLLDLHGKALLTPAEVCAAYFAPMSERVFHRKLLTGEIRLPVTRMGPGQKAPRMIHVEDLAKYIEERRKVAQNEMRSMGDV
jgi:hypothetical protein